MMKYYTKQIIPFILSLILLLSGCTNESICPDFENWGEFELKETSKQLLENLQNNDKVVFLDPAGTAIHFTLSRIDRFYERNFNCDRDGNGIINSGDPLVFNV